jgi:hypothetical protein
LSILSLSCWASGILLRKSLLKPSVSRVFSALSCTNCKVSCLILRSLIHFELILVQGDGMDLVSVFCRQIATFPSTICWRGCLFSIVCFWYLCQKQGGHSCVYSYLGPLFCSTGLLLFLLLWLCSIVWSQVLWYLQCWSFCSVLPWLFLWSLMFSNEL